MTKFYGVLQVTLTTEGEVDKIVKSYFKEGTTKAQAVSFIEDQLEEAPEKDFILMESIELHSAISQITVTDIV